MKESPITGLDSFPENAIREHIYAYYARREYQTISKLLMLLNEAILFTRKYSLLLKVFYNLGFELKKINGRKILLERGDFSGL